MFYGIQPKIKNVVVACCCCCCCCIDVSRVQMYLWRCFCTFAGVLHAGGRSWLRSIEWMHPHARAVEFLFHR